MDLVLIIESRVASASRNWGTAPRAHVTPFALPRRGIGPVLALFYLKPKIRISREADQWNTLGVWRRKPF